MPGEQAFDEPQSDPKFKFKTQVYFSVCDRLVTELQTRFADFNEFVEKFHCLLPNHLGDSVVFKELAHKYSSDIDFESSVAEYNQFTWFFKSAADIQQELANASVQEILLFFKKHRLDVAYPNLAILFRILGTISVSTAGAERSFSKLKLIKNYLRSTMGEERLSGLGLISMERDLADSLDFDKVIDRFSNSKKRKLKL